MAIAIVAALAIRETFTALVITLFVLAAENTGRAHRGTRAQRDPALARFAAENSDGPPRADGRMGIEEVGAGDIVLVRPGGRIPVDGVVVAGNSFVDQAAITGESLAVEKLPGTAFTPERSINPARSKFVSNGWAATQRSEKSSRKWNARKISRADSKDCRPACGLPGVFRARCRRVDVSDHAQHALNDIRRDRGRRVRHCGRHAAGDSGSHRPGRPERSDHQGRAASGNSFASRYRPARQDGDAELRNRGSA